MHDIEHKISSTFDRRLSEAMRAIPSWHPGAWGLPATLLSWTSLVAGLVMFAFLRRDAEVRDLFRVPFPVALATLCAAGAWTLTVLCRNRPGPLFPRLWSLSLSASATALFAVCVYEEATKTPSALTHALMTSVATSTITLAPRLLRLRADAWAVHRVAPMTLAIVLAAVLPAASCVEAMVRHQKDLAKERQISERRLSEALDKLKKLKGRLGKAKAPVLETPERGKPSDGVDLATVLDARLVDNPTLWSDASLLNRVQDLTNAYAEIIDALKQAFQAERCPTDPKASSVAETTPELWKAQVDTDVSEIDKYPEDYKSSIERLNQSIASYHHELQRLCSELIPTDINAAERHSTVCGEIKSAAPKSCEHLTPQSGPRAAVPLRNLTPTSKIDSTVSIRTALWWFAKTTRAQAEQAGCQKSTSGFYQMYCNVYARFEEPVGKVRLQLWLVYYKDNSTSIPYSANVVVLKDARMQRESPEIDSWLNARDSVTNLGDTSRDSWTITRGSADDDTVSVTRRFERDCIQPAAISLTLNSKTRRGG